MHTVGPNKLYIYIILSDCNLISPTLRPVPQGMAWHGLTCMPNYDCTTMGNRVRVQALHVSTRCERRKISQLHIPRGTRSIQRRGWRGVLYVIIGCYRYYVCKWQCTYTLSGEVLCCRSVYICGLCIGQCLRITHNSIYSFRNYVDGLWGRSDSVASGEVVEITWEHMRSHNAGSGVGRGCEWQRCIYERRLVVLERYIEVRRCVRRDTSAAQAPPRRGRCDGQKGNLAFNLSPRLAMTYVTNV